MGNATDLRGKVFGRLTVLYRVKNKGKAATWKCQCECGNIKEIIGTNLTSGHTTSCGCNKIRRYAEDLVGKKFGYLTCIRRSEQKCANHTMWECQCDCGNTVIVSRNALITGNTQSCGCYKKQQARERYEAKIPPGSRFGNLIVLEKAYHKNGNIYWKCKCDCGNITFVPSSHLFNGHTQSCGCLVSKGERKISELLNQNEIEFTTQQSFEDCKYSQESTKLPRFDFYVNNTYLIEYDGQQHFKPIGYFGGEEWFKIQQERDQYKNQWCKDNNIPLIRIPYTKFDTLCIEDLLLETTKFRIC